MAKWEEAAKEYWYEYEGTPFREDWLVHDIKAAFIAGAEYASKEHTSALQAIADYKPVQDWPTDLEFVREIAKAALEGTN